MRKIANLTIKPKSEATAKPTNRCLDKKTLMKEEKIHTTPENDFAGNSEEKTGKRKMHNVLSRLMNSMLSEGEKETREKVKWRDVFNVDWLRQHIAVIVIFLAGMVVMVTNRYQGQQEMLKEAQLREELEDAKYRQLAKYSELMTATRQSIIEQSLAQRGDSTLKTTLQPPYIITVKQTDYND